MFVHIGIGHLCVAATGQVGDKLVYSSLARLGAVVQQEEAGIRSGAQAGLLHTISVNLRSRMGRSAPGPSLQGSPRCQVRVTSALWSFPVERSLSVCLMTSVLHTLPDMWRAPRFLSDEMAPVLDIARNSKPPPLYVRLIHFCQARAVADEILPPSFLVDRYRLHYGGVGGMQVLKKVQKWLSEQNGKGVTSRLRKVYPDQRSQEPRPLFWLVKESVTSVRFSVSRLSPPFRSGVLI